MKKRLKRSTQQYLVVSLLSVIIIGGAFTLVYFTILRNIKDNYQNEIKILSEELESKKVYVYEAKVDIPVGCKVTKDSLNYIQSYSNQAQGFYMSEEDIGLVSLIEITKGTEILKGMLTKNVFENNAREVEYNSFLINSNIKENDFVDIRIMFPNGEDYIVLSKKSIKNLSLEINNCFLWLMEEEILNMSGAIVDAYLYSGTKLYTTKYIESNLQEASIITYQPSLSSLLLMEQDENIVDRASKELNKQLRKELESRLAIHSTKDVSVVEWDLPKDELAVFVPEVSTQVDNIQVENTQRDDNAQEENTQVENAQGEDYFIQDKIQDKGDLLGYGG